MNRTLRRVLILLGLAFFVLVMSGCTSAVTMPDGRIEQCRGIGEDRDPNINYHISGRNIAMGIIFMEFIAPPIIVLTNEFYCPRNYRHPPDSLQS